MDYLGKGEMLTKRDVNKFCERNKLFACMEHFCDLLLQLMKHGTNTLHVVFIFLYSIDVTDRESLKCQ
jgi:hypothetical protein